MFRLFGFFWFCLLTAECDGIHVLLSTLTEQNAPLLSSINNVSVSLFPRAAKAFVRGLHLQLSAAIFMCYCLFVCLFVVFEGLCFVGD